jgi:hypothetical protein
MSRNSKPRGGVGTCRAESPALQKRKVSLNSLVCPPEKVPNLRDLMKKDLVAV